MNKRLRLALVILLLAVFGLAVWFTLRGREPVYQGKKLSAWCRELSYFGYNGPATEEAHTALQHIGTNAIPHLLDRLQTRDYPWEDIEQQLYTRGHLEWLRLPRADDRRREAFVGFQALGKQAAPAIPKLLELCAETNSPIVGWAFSALSAIGDEKVLPNLMGWLTNSSQQPQQWYSITTLGNFRHLAQPAIPGILPFLDHTNYIYRYVATHALGEIAGRADLVVPALEKRLGDSNPAVVMLALQSLAEFGAEAASAIPALRAAAQDKDEHIRSNAMLALTRAQCEMRDGGIFRGPKEREVIALAFTGHEYGEGGQEILTELKKRNARASFFLTGDFLSNANFYPLIERMIEERHYLGPHSDKHLLYCEWDKARTIRVTREQFRADVESNQWKIWQLIEKLGAQPSRVKYFLPPYEHYNRQIADWSKDLGFTLVNFTPGTRSNADYTGEADKNFVSSQAIFDSIVKKEREDPHGLNGFILLLHLGSGPGRADKFHHRFGELLDFLSGKGCEFVRVDELLEPEPEKN